MAKSGVKHNKSNQIDHWKRSLKLQKEYETINLLKIGIYLWKVIGSRNQWYQLKAHWVPVVKSKRPTIKLIHICKPCER